MDGINVLSLFDGMGCGQIALNNLGIKSDNYYASEIDKYAMAVSKYNFPNTTYIGDVTKVKGNDLPEIDLLMGGSPCQGFSFSGKGLAFDDPRSKLFFEFIRLLKECKPKYFLLENVRMKKEYLDIISEHVGVEPICMNSTLVSAQNRIRYYWTNIPNIQQPDDKGIILKDILQSDHEIDDRYVFSKKRKEYIKSRPKNFECKIDPDKSNTLRTNYGNASANESFITYKCCASRGRLNSDNKYEQKIECRDDNKTNTITTTQKDNIVMVNYTEVRTEEAKKIRREYRKKHGKDFNPFREKKLIPRTDDKVNCLQTSLTNNHYVGEKVEQYENVSKSDLRKFTPIECERLQTVPDNFTLVPHPIFKKRLMSDSQRYKMLGNGWTIDVISHILKNIL